MVKEVSYSYDEETPEAKARWFQSLTLSERMDMLCFFTDMILENNPGIIEKRDAKPTAKRIQMLEKA
jgi:hypothetical protein